MGAWDWVDEAGDKAESAWKGAEKAVGEGADAVAHDVGGYLDKAGLHGAGHWIEDKGDQLASSLGAAVAERELGRSDDPKDLIHGDAKAIGRAAAHLKRFQAAFESAHSGLSRIDPGHWTGEGAEAFRTKFAPHPKQWLKAADACEKACGALERYAETVEWAQQQARDAIDLYRRGQSANKAAAKAYNDDVDRYNAAVDAFDAKVRSGADPGRPPTKPASATHPGDAGIAHAEDLLRSARRQRDSAAHDARRAIDAATELAPRTPAFTERMHLDAVDLQNPVHLEHIAGGVAMGLADTLKFARSVNPYDLYNITHPFQFQTQVNRMVAGMLSLDAHPQKLPMAVLGDGWRSDPEQAASRLLTVLGVGMVTGGEGAEATVLEGAGVGAGEGSAGGAAVIGREVEGSGEGAARRQVTANPRNFERPESARVCKDDPVDMATGRMILPQTDVSLDGALPLVFSRVFESSYRSGRRLGPSWSSTADQRLEIDSEGVIFVREDGLLLAYPHPAPGVPTLPAEGPRWPLDRAADGGYVITDPDTGRTLHFIELSPRLALLEQLSDRNGHWITYEYDDSGTPTGIRHESGYHIRITTDDGRITALHLAGAGEDGRDAELIRYGYTDGHLTEVVNSSGRPLRFGYDRQGRITSWTDRNGSHYEYAYDSLDRCVGQSGVDGHRRTSFAYDGTDPGTGMLVTTHTDSLGHTSRFVVNDALQVVAEIDPTGAVTRTERDRYDRVLSRTDPLGRTTRFTYDEAGRPTVVTRPDGRAAVAEYTALGLPKTVTAPDGAVWRQEYDERGNRTAVTDPAGATTRFTYDARGHLTEVTDALGNVTRVRCDAAGLPLEVTDPLGAATRYERDAFGRVVAITDPLGAVTRLKWTVEGKLARRTAPDGAEETWSYDGEGNCVTHVDAVGGVTRYEYTHFDQLAARTGPDGVRYEFEHDTELRLRKVVNPQGLTWTYDYDPVGRLVAETDFDGRTLTYAHDAAGRMVARTNALGQAVRYARDPLGRVIAKDADGRVTTYEHDHAGRLLQAAGPDVTLTYHRDRLGRVRSETCNGRTTTYTYDALGRRVRRVTPAGAVSTSSYDAAGRRTGLTTAGRTLAFAHDAAGREVARRFGETVTLASVWDVTGRLTGQSLASGSEIVQERSYEYRPDGNLVALEDRLSGRRTFDVDSAGRVTAVHAADWTERYAYDAAGNQTEASWPSGHPGQEAVGPRTYEGTRVVRAGRVRYEHDVQGRMVLRQRTRLSRKPDTWRYEWDAEDRLTSVTTPDGQVWRYLYDPLGRRIAKRRLGEEGSVLEEVRFTWDGPTLAEQTTTAAGLPHPVTLTWDHDGLRPLAQTERLCTADASQEEIDQRFFAIVTDLVGTPTELVDEAGRIAWRTRSTLWGTTAWAVGSTAYTPLRFPGQYFDPESGLHYNFHRYYDPETGRYASQDPLGLAPAPNAVTYVDSPHTWADPLGLSPCPPEGDSEAGPGPWDMTGRDPMSVVPDFASVRELKPDPQGGAQYGLEYKWVDSQGRTVRLRIHGPDGNAPAGSNAASGDAYRIQFGGKYQDGLGNLYPRNVHNPASPYYDPSAANDTHIPWPAVYPGL